MRHGETIWNSKGITQGRRNNRLGLRGIEQAKQSAEDLRNTKIDLIIVSPLCRTVQTANIMNTFHNVKVVKDERIIEIEQGIYTGKKYSSLTSEEKRRKNLRLIEDGVESYQNAYMRTKSFIEDIKRNFGNLNVLIVTHNFNASCIEGESKCKQFKDFNFRCFDNAQVKQFDI